MIIHFYKPHDQLKSIVSNLMIYNAELDPEQPPVISVHPPVPEHCLYFYPRTPCVSHSQQTGERKEHPHCLIVGPVIERVNLSIGHDHIVIRVGFHPGGLYRLLGLPTHELFNHPLDGYDLFGQQIKEVNEQLALAQDYETMKNIVETFLLIKAMQGKVKEKFDDLMAVLMRQEAILRVEEVADEACMSFRQLERKFKERLGMPPKLFLKLIRFSKAYRMHESQPALRWTDIAHINGYFDQAHLIRDFRQFTGVAPRAIETELAQTPLRLQAHYLF
ncbi:helix-turn-helix domain-containing protein [Pontibacter locisalis]|uniref:Helix-turn-helix domain-containing protein n=1 Tax=Pontibacter locisalis TaxID=1719035 RepID=A0ABW5ISK3_9BACT